MNSVTEVVRRLSNQPEKYAGQESFFGDDNPLSQSIGYIVVLGFGAAFSIFTTLLVLLEKKFAGGKAMSSEKFK